jgi:hypothetical protein
MVLDGELPQDFAPLLGCPIRRRQLEELQDCEIVLALDRTNSSMSSANSACESRVVTEKKGDSIAGRSRIPSICAITRWTTLFGAEYPSDRPLIRFSTSWLM